MKYALDYALFGLLALYCLACPYTKVEESFNIQAVHDIVTYGVSPSALPQYDHLEFPGVVPRTFLGALLLSAYTYPITMILRLINRGLGWRVIDSKFVGQLVARLTLAFFTCISMHYLRLSVRKAFGQRAERWFFILTCSQFHTMFWTSRPLPNMFAFPMVVFAFAHWLEVVYKRNSMLPLRHVLHYTVMASSIFRFEVALLAGCIVLPEWLIFRSISFREILLNGSIVGAFSVMLSTAVDSYFWRHLCWPEWEVFWFNGVEQRSSEWGVSPPHAYFTVHLPKLLLASLPLVVYALCAQQLGSTGRNHKPRGRPLARFFIPCLAYVTLFSCIGHKEWRFIVYVVPMMNVIAAVGASTIEERSRTSRLHVGLLRLLQGAVIPLSLSASVGLLLISAWNYPGGHSLAQLHDLVPVNYTDAKVHLDVYVAMTGASRFGQRRELNGGWRPPYPVDNLPLQQWQYFKNEQHIKPGEFVEAGYTHLLTTTPMLHKDRFDPIGVTDGFGGISVHRQPLQWLNASLRQKRGRIAIADIIGNNGLIHLSIHPKVWIMERKEQ
ncbi:hypothetical protein BZG36_04471 [Bifiguratus adelaidae]|uniref:Mannosyltransferase n=1 Tax=Bifiguratus adelaidae TaxID=1938954 RepID=A0A261XVH2_9FUNG|nr:hypothetical protein BZG36_04471 [Bifiguratus adelaidae]